MLKRRKTLNANSIRRTASEIKTYRLLMRMLPVTAGLLAAIVSLTFVVSALYNKYGAFTVTIDKTNFVKYGIALCELPDFSAPTSKLNSKASENVTCISVKDLPGNLNTVNGEHNGANYLAYTFFLKNMGTDTVDVGHSIIIANMTLGIEEAARVRLYVGKFDKNDINHTDPYVDYAKTRTDGMGPEADTVEFLSTGIIEAGDILALAPGDVYRFTVVIWLEGDDPECVDDIIGGEFKVDMNFSIINIEEETA